MFPHATHLRPGPMLLLPTYPPALRFLSPHVPANTNASAASSLPRSFPLPAEGRDDFFCVDPQSLSDEQLEHYGEEMRRLTDMEKENFERIRSDCSARMHAYTEGRRLAQEAMKKTPAHPPGAPQSALLPNFNVDDDGPIGCVDPASLSRTQLQLYIEGISEEIAYEQRLTDEFRKESTSRIDAYQNGIQRANDGQ